tara:strand:+ start:296 stop:1267 length:972 start_codon:yes stop_codon:yes gene_type:complete
MITKKTAKKHPKFYCHFCDFSSSDKQDWKRHLLTRKHISQRNDNKNDNKGNTSCAFSCSNCGKEYKHRSGLSRHKKKCKSGTTKNVDFSSKICSKTAKIENSKKNVQNFGSEISDKNLIKMLVEQNEKLMSQTQKLVEIIPKIGNTTNNNTQNNNISINVYLNEHCKDAMNLKDFVQQLKITVDDLVFQGENGYIKGIENIFTKRLQDLPPTERPIHCSDKKRMQFYVKEDDEWQKDNTHEKIDKTLSDLTIRQIHELKKWEEMHPNYLTNDKEMKHWQQLVSEITGNNSATKSGKKQRDIIKKNIAQTTNMKDAIQELQKDS